MGRCRETTFVTLVATVTCFVAAGLGGGCAVPVTTEITSQELARVANDEARSGHVPMKTRSGKIVSVPTEFDARVVPVDPAHAFPAVRHPVYVLMERDRLVLPPTPEEPAPLEIGIQYIDHVEIRHRQPSAAPAVGAVGGALLTFLIAAAVMGASCENSSDFRCVVVFATVVPGVSVAGGFVGGYGARALAAKREP